MAPCGCQPCRARPMPCPRVSACRRPLWLPDAGRCRPRRRMPDDADVALCGRCVALFCVCACAGFFVLHARRALSPSLPRRLQDGLHKVKYEKDDEEEWLNFDEEHIVVSVRVVWCRIKGHPWWPAKVGPCSPTAPPRVRPVHRCSHQRVPIPPATRDNTVVASF